MAYLNISMIVYKFIQCHLFYDGLAASVPEVTSQGSVAAALVVILILEMPRRGLFFSYGKSLPRLNTRADLFQLAKYYHGYLISFGTVYTFHYHPMEGTMAHYMGFMYQFLLLHQSTLLFHEHHRNFNWTIILETFVWIHGLLVALWQRDPPWLQFGFGFAAIFVITQVWGIPAVLKLPRLVRLVLCGGCVALFIVLWPLAYALAGRIDKIYLALTIPAAEYGFVLVFYALFVLASHLIQLFERLGVVSKEGDGVYGAVGLDGKIPRGLSLGKFLLVAVLYAAVGTIVLLGYALVLGRRGLTV
jgi:hypothetical protein